MNDMIPFRMSDSSLRRLEGRAKREKSRRDWIKITNDCNARCNYQNPCRR